MKQHLWAILVAFIILSIFSLSAYHLKKEFDREGKIEIHNKELENFDKIGKFLLNKERSIDT